MIPQGLVGWLQRDAERLLDQAREPVRITSVRRSPGLQAKLWRRRQAGQHPYPVAPPGQSLHEYGLAWDMVASDAELARLGRIWERMGHRWGGRFNDNIHFEAGRRALMAHREDMQRVREGVSAGKRLVRQAASPPRCMSRGRCARL